jgi:hypothetical protein
MSAVNVPSGIAFGVTLIPANPVSPFRGVKVERYVPGGGPNFVGDGAVDVVEEHAPMSRMPPMIGVVTRIDRSLSSAVMHTGLFVMDIPLSLEAENSRQNWNAAPKGLK